MATKPLPDVTVKQAAAVLYGDDNPTHVKRVQRLITSGHLEAVKLPGETGPYLIRPASLRALQQKLEQKQTDKKRRQAKIA